MSKQQKRYQKLNGEPIHTGTWKAAAHLASIQAGILTTAYNAAANAYLEPEQMASTLLWDLGCVAVASTGLHWIRNAMLKDIFQKKVGNSCVDTHPNNHTPPTSPNNLLRAETMKNTAKSILKMLPPMSFLMFSDLPVVPAGAVAAIASIASDFYRFEKITKGKWNIVDMPEPEKQKENLPVAAPQLT